MVYNCLNIVRSILYPHTCTLCGEISSLDMDICEACLRDLDTLQPRCQCCGIPLITAGYQGKCGQCLIQPPDFYQLHAAFDYQSPLNRLIADIKFRHKVQLTRMLAQAWLSKVAPDIKTLPDVILPIPLHNKRLRQRGYNQALELARPISKQLGIPLETNCIRRVRATQPQSDLSARERQKNIRGAFTLVEPIPGRHIVLFDDVVTTGSTVNELAGLLLSGGAERVDVWCIARANPR